MILIQEEVAPKRYNLSSLHREKKMKFQGWVEIEGTCGCAPSTTEG